MKKIEVMDYKDSCWVKLVSKKDFKTLEEASMILAELREYLEANNGENKRLYLTAETQRAVEPVILYVEEIKQLCYNLSNIYLCKEEQKNED